MSAVSVAIFGLFLSSPPSLPPDIGDVPPPVEDAPVEDAPVEDAPVEDAPVEDAPVEDAPSASEDPPASEDPAGEDAAPSEDPAPTDESIPVEGDEGEPPGEDTIPVEPSDDDGAAGAAAGGATIQQPSSPSVQQPGGARGNPGATETSPTPKAEGTKTEGPGPAPEPATKDEDKQEESYRKLGGFRLFRVGLGAKIGYTHGTSSKNGLYDRQKTIDDSIENMMLTPSGAGDLGKTKFGGFAYGFILDAEIVGINLWLDFHKFFTPGGMWSLLLGYDHEFGFGKRLRLDVGVAGGLNQVFLGKVLSGLYYDQDSPEAVNIGTLGVEGRAMVDLHIKLVGPLFTGPYAMLGYHYLWSANVEEVTAEKGLHYSAGWSLRVDFGAPKIIGGKKKK